MMHYNVIFDITQTGYHHWSQLVFSIVSIVVTMGFLCYRKRTNWRPLAKTVPLGFFLCFFSLFSIFMFVHNYQNYLNIQSALRQSQCVITEGTVTQLHPAMSWKRNRNPGEVFVVDGEQFIYRDGSAQNGFHQLGVIHNGMQVRIFHYDGDDWVDKDIARLEIAQ